MLESRTGRRPYHNSLDRPPEVPLRTSAVNGCVWRGWGIIAGSCSFVASAQDAMLLDLSKLRGQREHFERTFQPSAFDPQDDTYRVAIPVELSMDIEKAGP